MGSLFAGQTKQPLQSSRRDSLTVGEKGMTIDLAMQINAKLQSVLEDALLKNIMLKVHTVSLITVVFLLCNTAHTAY